MAGCSTQPLRLTQGNATFEIGNAIDRLPLGEHKSPSQAPLPSTLMLRPQRLPKQLAAARNAVGVGAYCQHQGRSAGARFPARHRNPLVGVTVRRPACDLKIDLAVSVTCQFDTKDRIQFDEDARADQGAPPCRAAPRRAGGMPDQCTVLHSAAFCIPPQLHRRATTRKQKLATVTGMPCTCNFAAISSRRKLG
jgi:hypothetical protein